MRIFLIGFMGSGKSSLGKELSSLLGYSFIDLDNLIEEKAGKRISEIFSADGEEKFREIEHQCLKDSIQHDNCVISTGGGTPCFYDNMEIINRNGFSIYIRLNAGMLASRLISVKDDRPLLKNAGNKAELQKLIEEMLSAREEYYLQSMMMVEGKNITAKKLRNMFELP